MMKSVHYVFATYQVRDSFLVLHSDKNKTDQYRQSNKILISKGSTSACPYNMFLNYLQLVDSGGVSEFFLFRPIYRSGSTCKLIRKNKKRGYTAARTTLLKRINLVSPHCDIGLHSFRSGGATVAAHADVSERCLKKHGRWKSDFSKDGYILDSTEKRLSVLQVLGL